MRIVRIYIRKPKKSNAFVRCCMYKYRFGCRCVSMKTWPGRGPQADSAIDMAALLWNS